MEVACAARSNQGGAGIFRHTAAGIRRSPPRGADVVLSHAADCSGRFPGDGRFRPFAAARICARRSDPRHPGHDDGSRPDVALTRGWGRSVEVGESAGFGVPRGNFSGTRQEFINQISTCKSYRLKLAEGGPGAFRLRAGAGLRSLPERAVGRIRAIGRPDHR